MFKILQGLKGNKAANLKEHDLNIVRNMEKDADEGRRKRNRIATNLETERINKFEKEKQLQIANNQYQKSDRKVILNGGSRMNIVYHKGGGKEPFVKVGGSFKSLDKNYEKKI